MARQKEDPLADGIVDHGRKMMEATPGVARIQRPAVDPSILRDYSSVMDVFKTSVAQLAMENLFDELTANTAEGRDMLKIMAPYMFRKQAQVIETRQISGEIESSTAQALSEYLAEDRE